MARGTVANLDLKDASATSDLEKGPNYLAKNTCAVNTMAVQGYPGLKP